ncbi:hypothetical protein [Tenuifilum thalassicum]|uniref:Uncharacterized protein n=1 Tax=Tenuifilum thalassicum TaxID=2590900 RepID=A0A7D3XLU2_9BACT|nr:hypothetical protein [Tenuifilum thalassicum]QKG80595.1 hypothetical protein FHG85_10040 [Tenuifilum thalassicum]
MPDKYQIESFSINDAIRPVTFNPIKHHREHVCSLIYELHKQNNLDYLKSVFASIGGTLIDFYIGTLTVIQIANEVISILANEKVNNFSEYKSWLGFPKTNYKCVKLSDDSTWVLKLGNKPEYFVHIHPGRYSSNTVRCRPNTLKVAITIRSLIGFDEEKFDLQLVNLARDIVGLSPLGQLKPHSAISRMVSILNVNCG